MKRYNLESTGIKGLIPESLIDDANALIIFIAEYYIKKIKEYTQ